MNRLGLEDTLNAGLKDLDVTHQASFKYGDHLETAFRGLLREVAVDNPVIKESVVRGWDTHVVFPMTFDLYGYSGKCPEMISMREGFKFSGNHDWSTIPGMKLSLRGIDIWVSELVKEGTFVIATHDGKNKVKLGYTMISSTDESRDVAIQPSINHQVRRQAEMDSSQ